METIVYSLIFLLGTAAGYIWRDHISRARHDRARVEMRKERMQMMGILDTSIDGAYRPQGWPKE